MRRVRITVAENVRQYTTYEADLDDSLAAELCSTYPMLTSSLYLDIIDERIRRIIATKDARNEEAEPGDSPEFAYEVTDLYEVG
jgi:hypothetical protein